MSNQDDFVKRFVGLSLANVASNLMIPLSGSISLFFLGHLSGIDDLAGPLLRSFYLISYIMVFIFYGRVQRV